MAEKLTGLQFAEEVLKQADLPLTIKGIFDEGKKQGLQHSYEGKTPQNTLDASIRRSIKDYQQNSPFCIVSRRPTVFWLRSRENELQNDESLQQEHNVLDQILPLQLIY